MQLETDASPYGLSAILSHNLPDGSNKPIAYASCSLFLAESRYAQLDREALALFWGAKKFYQYLYGCPVTFVMDNKPVQQIMNPSKELPVYTATRMLRYAVFLSQFNYQIKHQPAKEHEHVDYFSRSPVEKYPQNVTDECTFLQNICLEILNCSATSTHTISIERI